MKMFSMFSFALGLLLVVACSHKFDADEDILKLWLSNKEVKVNVYDGYATSMFSIAEVKQLDLSHVASALNSENEIQVSGLSFVRVPGTLNQTSLYFGKEKAVMIGWSGLENNAGVTVYVFSDKRSIDTTDTTQLPGTGNETDPVKTESKSPE